MDVARTLALGTGLSRILFGAGYLIRPGQARPSWIGRAARKPATQVVVRSQAARDIGLGGGALYAVTRGDRGELSRWMLAHALADGTDLVATWAARDALPKRRARLAMVVAAGSALAAGVAAATARAQAPPAG